MTAIDPHTRNLLKLTLVPGLGPVRIAALLDALGDAPSILSAPERTLAATRGIGPKLARAVAHSARELDARADAELERLARLGAQVLAIGTDAYPPLLAAIPGAPPILTVRGQLRPHDGDRTPVAVVGARRCTSYGIEQADRFGAALAQAGLTVVSGGARGIDTAAHRGALRAGGRTVAVLGCGLAHCYPPENAPLFAEIIAAGGAVVSELPAEAGPKAEHFPSRNRIISGLSLGTLVIEAGARSGALITARMAAEDHGREVLGVPGRVDSAASAGVNQLLRGGGAGVALEPADVLDQLRSAAHHLFADRAADIGSMSENPALGTLTSENQPGVGVEADDDGAASGVGSGAGPGLSAAQAAILAALEIPLTFDELAARASVPVAALRSEITLLEVLGRVRRVGSRLERSPSCPVS